MTNDPISTLQSAANWVEGLRLGPKSFLTDADPEELAVALQRLLNESRDLAGYLHTLGILETYNLTTVVIQVPE